MKYAGVIIHVNDSTNPKQRKILLNRLTDTVGVITPKFSEEKGYLLLVSYDSEVTNSLALLNQVKDNGFESQLVGL